MLVLYLIKNDFPINHLVDILVSAHAQVPILIVQPAGMVAPPMQSPLLEQIWLHFLSVGLQTTS